MTNTSAIAETVTAITGRCSTASATAKPANPALHREGLSDQSKNNAVTARQNDPLARSMRWSSTPFTVSANGRAASQAAAAKTPIAGSAEARLTVQTSRPVAMKWIP